MMEFAMLCFESMIAGAAQDAGMKVPPLDALDVDDGWQSDEYPHFMVFCALQLNRRMAFDEHWSNAKVIAAIPDDEIKMLMLSDFIARGFIYPVAVDA
jgi:hypothetical protein